MCGPCFVFPEFPNSVLDVQIPGHGSLLGCLVLDFVIFLVQDVLKLL